MNAAPRLFTTSLTCAVPLRDAAWLDEETLLASDGEGALWRIEATRTTGAHEVEAERVDDGRALLMALATRAGFLGRPSPASGTYPLVHVAPNGALVVIPYDLALTVRPPGSESWIATFAISGLYYPDVSFDRSETLGLAQVEDAHVFDTRTGAPLDELVPGSGVAAWHPRDPRRLLRYRAEDGVLLQHRGGPHAQSVGIGLDQGGAPGPFLHRQQPKLGSQTQGLKTNTAGSGSKVPDHTPFRQSQLR